MPGAEQHRIVGIGRLFAVLRLRANLDGGPHRLQDRSANSSWSQVSRPPMTLESLGLDPDIFDPDCEPVNSKGSSGPLGLDLEELSFRSGPEIRAIMMSK